MSAVENPAGTQGAAEATPMLQLEGINTFYGQIHILQDSNMIVREGELVCLLGGNASGKSTTLKTILGLVRPRTGTVRLASTSCSRCSTSGARSSPVRCRAVSNRWSRWAEH